MKTQELYFLIKNLSLTQNQKIELALVLGQDQATGKIHDKESITALARNFPFLEKEENVREARVSYLD